MIESPEQFIALRSSGNPEDYRRAAQEEAPLHVWKELVETHKDIRFWGAQNKTVPELILGILSTDPDPNVRAMVASKRKLPEKIQLRLAQDSNDSVRHRLVHNAKVSRNALKILSEDSWSEVSIAAQEKIEQLTSGVNER